MAVGSKPVADDGGKTPEDIEDTPREEDQRGTTETLAIILVLSGFYCMITIVVGFVLPVSSILNGSDTSEHYIVVFYCLMSSFGVLCLIVIWVILAFCTGKTKRKGTKKTNYDMVDVKGPEGKADQVPAMAVYYKKDGASVFVIGGALVFGTGFLLFQILKLGADCRLNHAVEHYITDSFSVLSLFVQTAVLCYYNKACINIHKGWVAFALCHLIAVNMCTWVMVVVFGVAHEIAEVAHEQSEHEESSGEVHLEDTTSHLGVIESHHEHMNHSTDGASAVGLGPLGTNRNGTFCYTSESLIQKVSPFLIPCVIEYTLIMVAILYSMLTSIGRKVKNEEIKKWEGVRTRKVPVVVAVYLGCMLIGVAIAGGVFANVLDEYHGLVFHACEVFLALVSLVAMGVSLVQMRGLGIQPLESFFDITLLLVSYAAFNIVEVFTLLPAIWQVNIHENYHDTVVGASALGRHVIELVQGFVQVLYILCGAGRYTRTKDQAARRPGRVSIIILLFANLGLWLLRVLNEDLQFNQYIWRDYYGALPWTIIKSTCSPLVIFFRFHSCVCLADMVTGAYKPKRD